MKVLILGNSNIFQRKIYFALKKFKNIEIEVASKRKINKNLKIKKNYFSYNEAINNTEAKLVYISLINSKHCYWALKSLKNNKHVIVDKPLALNFEQSNKLLKLAIKKKLLLSEAIVFQYHDQFKKILSRINVEKTTIISSKFHIPRLKKKNFRNYKRYGGGCFQDMSAYAAYLIYIFIKNKKYSLKKNLINKNGCSESFDLTIKSKNIFLNSKFSFNSKYENNIIITNKSKKYFINFAFSPPIYKSLDVMVFDQMKKRRYKIHFKKQNTFYTYFDKIFNVIKKKNYNFFYKEIKELAKIKKKIS